MITEQWPGIKTLHIGDTAVSPAGLRYLRRLKDLDDLEIYNVPLNDDQAQPLYDLHRLRTLDISNTRISERTIKGFITAHRDKRMPRLEKIYVHGVPINENVHIDAEKEGVHLSFGF